MKKLALSAAILAMAMMGCSDTGLDNSVASTTSDAEKEQILNTSEKIGSLLKHLVSEDRFQAAYAGEVKAEGYSFYPIAMSSVNKNKQGVGKYFVQVKDGKGRLVDNSKIDVVHIVTINVAGCYMNGYEPECEYVKWHVEHFFDQKFGAIDEYTTQKMAVCQTAPLSVPSKDEITTISSYASVWHMGQSNEVILQGMTYAGYLYNDMYNHEASKQLALLVANKYIMMAYEEDLRNYQ